MLEQNDVSSRLLNSGRLSALDRLQLHHHFPSRAKINVKVIKNVFDHVTIQYANTSKYKNVFTNIRETKVICV